MKHVQLDLETGGTRAGCVILSIGAVEFELDGQNDKQFYANIDPKSCEAAGLKLDPRTMEWWGKQPAEAVKPLMVDRRPLLEVLEEFRAWFRSTKAEMIWSHGASFDVPILEAAMVSVGIMETPWRFWHVRDTRTLYDLAGFDARTMNRVGTHHHALDDALFQVDCVAAAYAKLNPRRSVLESF